MELPHHTSDTRDNGWASTTSVSVKVVAIVAEMYPQREKNIRKLLVGTAPSWPRSHRIAAIVCNKKVTRAQREMSAL